MYQPCMVNHCVYSGVYTGVYWCILTHTNLTIMKKNFENKYHDLKVKSLKR